MIRSAVRRLGRLVTKRAPETRAADIEPDFWPLYDACRDATMTSIERLYALHKAVDYVVRHDIPGDFVECGVWRGGSVMMMALTLHGLGATRAIHCYDTFEGMPPPSGADVRDETGEDAAAILARTPKQDGDNMWAIAALDLVRQNVRSTGYPEYLVSYHKGLVEETVPASAPQAISLLRLDTDWYESTKHELVHLYPRLASGGILIIDDYGFWRGARKATDEYLAESQATLFLSRIDDTGRIGVRID
ncbi:MAG TPA: TylF/MycF/NovP-related O-methyltransferase [Stellaceae bacterium]|nr:TylF/MycF/NovP-related O-methyltransferase [Stellaceae bacterium]